MKDIARAAGCDTSTVSLALRDDPRISEARRSRIKAIAADMNYSANPLISAWVQARRASIALPQHIPIAYLACHPRGFDWMGSVHYATIFQGAKDQLRDHGFKLEVFQLQEYRRDFKRLNEVLFARNINGIIVGPSTRHFQIEGLDWDRYASLAIGYALEAPKLHRVSEDHYIGMKLVVRHCLETGCRRIGLGIAGAHNEERFQRWLAAYLLEQHLLSEEARLPVFRSEGGSWEKEARQWLEENEPDVVLTDEPEKWSAFRIRTMSFAISDIDNADTPGIVENNREIGKGAGDALVGLLYRNERGIPVCRRTVLVDPQEAFDAAPTRANAST